MNCYLFIMLTCRFSLSEICCIGSFIVCNLLNKVLVASFAMRRLVCLITLSYFSVIYKGDPCFSLYLCIVFLLLSQTQIQWKHNWTDVKNSQTQIWWKHNWAGVKNGVRMSTNKLVWLCGHKKNGPNQTSFLVVYRTPALTSYYVMEFRELTWKSIILRVHTSPKVKWKLAAL